MLNSKPKLIVLTFLVLYFSLGLTSFASPLIYTIQTGSFKKNLPAQKQLTSLIQVLEGEKLGYLRIEKVGKYYAVRIGKFQDYASAKKFLRTIKPQIPKAFILKADIIDERTILRLYRSND